MPIHVGDEIRRMGDEEFRARAYEVMSHVFDLALYEEVASHLCGQPVSAEANVEISLAGRSLGLQAVRLAAPRIALRITAMPPEGLPVYQAHLCRFLDHADVDAVQWINVTRHLVQFKTIDKRG